MIIALGLSMMPPVILNASSASIVINEVELNPPGNDNYLSVEEWVELYNPTSKDIDVGGWSLSTTHGKRTVTITIPGGTVIKAGGYLVISRGSQWLDNEDESIILRDSGGNIVDQTPLLSDTYNDGRTWQRYPNGRDTNSLSDWVFKLSTKERSNGGEEKPEERPEEEEPAVRYVATKYEIDAVSRVYKVVDGDTFDAFPTGRVRLADIDAPEFWEEGYEESKGYLTSLILGKTVYLDVDDVSVMDRYNRLVCVVYVRYNSTHILNVNLLLVIKGYAKLSDYPNEFSPSEWGLYAYYPEELEKGDVKLMMEKYLELKEAYENLTANYSRLLEEYETLKEDYHYLDMSYSKLESAYGTLKEENSKLKTEISELEENINQLKDEISKLKAEIETLKSESMKWQAISVITGVVAFIAGMATMHLINKFKHRVAAKRQS